VADHPWEESDSQNSKSEGGIDYRDGRVEHRLVVFHLVERFDGLRGYSWPV
jgi:hypothetical protein